MRLYPSPYAGSAFAAADPTAADTLPPQLAGAARCELRLCIRCLRSQLLLCPSYDRSWRPVDNGTSTSHPTTLTTTTARYESEAGAFWEAFYRRNRGAFFRDRHYLDKEWPALRGGAPVVLEVGCGVGNSVFPLLEANPRLRVFCCDFAPAAVALVKAHPAYASGRVTAFVADAARAALAAPAGPVPAGGVDFATLIFALSALAPEAMPAALSNVAATLKRGEGRVLFRDYARGDLAQVRTRALFPFLFASASVCVCVLRPALLSTTTWPPAHHLSRPVHGPPPPRPARRRASSAPPRASACAARSSRAATARSASILTR